MTKTIAFIKLFFGIGVMPLQVALAIIGVIFLAVKLIVVFSY